MRDIKRDRRLEETRNLDTYPANAMIMSSKAQIRSLFSKFEKTKVSGEGVFGDPGIGSYDVSSRRRSKERQGATKNIPRICRM